jgi:hypothetical protein
MKAGTTSLHEYLHQHPQIFMSRYKEPQYFCPHRLPNGLLWGEGNPHPEPGIDWYLKLFADAGDALYAGESTTNYTKMPVIDCCAARIYRFNPEARLIYLMRDPVERTISHYWWEVTGRREVLPPLRAIRRDPQYTAYSHYSYQLKPYLDLFGRDRIFLLTLEEIQARPREVFHRLFQWLGVVDTFVPDTSQRVNQGSKAPRKLRRGMGWTVPIRQHWRWGRISSRIPSSFRQAIEAVLLKPIKRNKHDMRPVVEYLRNIQRAQTDELAKILGRWPQEWTTLQPEIRSVGAAN